MDEIWQRKQLDKFNASFDETDKNKNGTLSFDEVYKMMLFQGFSGSRTEAWKLFGHMDQNKDKTVTRAEFETAMKLTPKHNLRDFVYRKLFKSLDKDFSGILSKAEIADATKKEGGIELSDKLISDLLVQASAGGDESKINYEQFLKVLKRFTLSQKLEKIFKAMDADNSGSLTRAEVLDTVSSDSELKLEADQISNLVIALIKDDDGQLNMTEFLDAWNKGEGQK